MAAKKPKFRKGQRIPVTVTLDWFIRYKGRKLWYDAEGRVWEESELAERGGRRRG